MDKLIIRKHFDKIAHEYDCWKAKNSYYYDSLKFFFRSVIPPGKTVLELGCATGEILASVSPGKAIGVDNSIEMVRLARGKYPSTHFLVAEAEKLCFKFEFDYVIMSDLLDHVCDLTVLFDEVKSSCKETQIVITTINPLWEPILKLCELIGMKMPESTHNYVPLQVIKELLHLSGFSIVSSGHFLLLPKKVPIISKLFNRWLTRIPFIESLSCVEYVVARCTLDSRSSRGQSCSVIIPCHNEVRNIEECVRRIPTMGCFTEIIIVDDGSTDGTAQKAMEIARDHENVKVISYKPNRGKGFAVKTGFEAAKGDILLILDADISIMPEELPRFFEPIATGKVEFVNGSRMTYPMERQAMRYLNLVGNRFFALIVSFLIGYKVTDCLCGTKALRKSDYKYIRMGRDRWGDFDLLFGAARLNLSVGETQVHYGRRAGGESKMKPLKHGLHLVRICLFALVELKFKPIGAKLRRHLSACGKNVKR